jgi:fatty acid desaturase
MHISTPKTNRQEEVSGSTIRDDPRVDMQHRLPAIFQPFLTWLTAKPTAGENKQGRSAYSYVVEGIFLTTGGCLLSNLALDVMSRHLLVAIFLLPTGLVVTTSGLGLFQVCIFHHCAHNAIFRNATHNRTLGRVISALLLFKYFDAYKHDHILHHNPKILFTLEDEFSDFIVNMCNISAGVSRQKLWAHLIVMLISPVFHGKFIYRRICGSLQSNNRTHNVTGISLWTILLIGSVFAHLLLFTAVAWILPVTILLQTATVFRILCEHRVPNTDIIDAGGRALICKSTAAVFPGARPPPRYLTSWHAALLWTFWWTNMLTVQLFVRLFVLVGDSPCHDFHHRRPGKRWTSYIHARQADQDEGCPGFPFNYIETWGLFRAINENFQALSIAPKHLLS